MYCILRETLSCNIQYCAENIIAQHQYSDVQQPRDLRVKSLAVLNSKRISAESSVFEHQCAEAIYHREIVTFISESI